MAKRERNPRAGCFVKRGAAYEITELGLAHVREMAAIGARPSEIAQYFNVGADFMLRALDYEHELYKPEIEEAFNEGATEFKRRILMAQSNLAETNAQMAIHLGKHHLGQKDDAQEVNHTIRVVGTLPDYEGGADEWRRRFAPTPLQVVDAPKASRGELVEVEEAEIVKE